MSNGKFYIKAYTETDILIILPHYYYTRDKNYSPSIYVLYWWILASVAILSSDFNYNQFHTKINVTEASPVELHIH